MPLRRRTGIASKICMLCSNNCRAPSGLFFSETTEGATLLAQFDSHARTMVDRLTWAPDWLELTVSTASATSAAASRAVATPTALTRKPN